MNLNLYIQMKSKPMFILLCIFFLFIAACDNYDQLLKIKRGTIEIIHDNKIIFDAGFVISKATAFIESATYQKSFDLNIDHTEHIISGSLSDIPYDSYTLKVELYENDKLQFSADKNVLLKQEKLTVDDLDFKKVEGNDNTSIITDQFLSVHKGKDLKVVLGPSKDKDGNNVTYTVTPTGNFTSPTDTTIVYNNSTIGTYVLNVIAKQTNNTETSAKITISVKEPIILQAPSDILFVGNSLTHSYGDRWGNDSESKKGAVKYHLQQIYNELNLTSSFVEAIRGGASLKRHWGYDNPNVPDSPGNTYEIDSIKKQHAITILQPGSYEFYSDPPSEFREFAKKFVDLSQSQNSTPIFYNVWALRGYEDTHDAIQNGMTAFCNENNLQFVNVGQVVHQIYNTDQTAGKELYNRLFAGSSDDTHLSIEGMYMVGLCFAKFFTGVNAVDINYRVEEADQAYADMLKQTVDQIITNRYSE